MIGSNQKYFITVGTDLVRSYPVKANGAIGAQVSQIDTQNYSGSNCGTTNGAVLDHSGQDVYVLLNVPPDGVNVCNAFQTFKIATASGQLTFNGSTTINTGAPAMRNLPTFLSNNKYAYLVNNFDFVTQFGDTDVYLTSESSFLRETNGTLESFGGFWDFPAPPPADDPGYSWFPLQVTSDPSNHLAIAMHPWFDAPFGTTGGAQIGSFTVDSQGNAHTTNTYKNMPFPDVFPTYMNMSPDGKLLAVAGGTSGGLQVFHFNGAAPITKYGKVLTTGLISWIRWDKTNHLYALGTGGKLYVYTITPTSIAAAPGSPYTISGPAGLFVVPK